MRPVLLGVLAPLALLSCLVPLGTNAATMPAVQMRVVDAQDGSPIPGVVALFWGSAHEGTLTGHGGRHAVLFAAEAVSDASGALRFPKQEFGSQPFFLNTNYENPSMLLLKPGYAPLVVRNDLRIIPTLAEASRWEREGGTAKMKRATDAEIQTQAYVISLYTDTMLAQCTWKRVPRALVAVDRMFPNPGKTTTLGILLMNDATFAQQGCGSPKTFFEPYLPR
jgi:hypothetical protein